MCFPGDCAEDERVGRNHGDERDDVHEENGEGAVERFLPCRCVRSVRHALVEVFDKWTTNHTEYEELCNRTTIVMIITKTTSWLSRGTHTTKDAVVCRSLSDTVVTLFTSVYSFIHSY